MMTMEQRSCLGDLEHRFFVGMSHVVCARCWWVPEPKDQKRIRKAVLAIYTSPGAAQYIRETKEIWQKQAEHTGFTTRQIRLMMLYGRECAYCKRPFTPARPPTLDHKVPRSRAGEAANKDTNHTAACYSCNHDKGSMTHVEYMRYLDAVKILGLTKRRLRNRVRKAVVRV